MMRTLVGSALLASALLSSGTGVAHAGFFDMLFGNAGNAPIYAPQPHDSFLESRPFERARRPARKVAAEPKEDHAAIKEAAKNTDILHDKTLRPGDVVMTANGVRVFDGDRSSRHDSEDFAEVSDAKGISRELRTSLDAINAHRSQPSWQVGEADVPVQTGRSSAGANATATRTSLDQDGRTIRVVGP